MENKNNELTALNDLLNTTKIATLDRLKQELNTQSTMTVYRKLKALGYLSSYSHRGKYYTLKNIPQFDHLGLWTYHSVWFSQYGNLNETTYEFVQNSTAGLSANELQNILHVEVKHSLFKLFQEKRIDRQKYSGRYIYLSVDPVTRRQQITSRKNSEIEFDIDLSLEIGAMADELKAAIILFFSLLNEKQRRLYAGLEAHRIGYGGDKKIAELFGLDPHTVGKGRKELFSSEFATEGVRKKGGGRKSAEKKLQKLSKKSNDS